MAVILTADDAKQSLSAHVAAKGVEIYTKYGPHIGWKELQQIVQDRACVRYPCEIVFDASGLLEGELAHPMPNSDDPEDGFKLHVHPIFMPHLDKALMLVLYQLVLVNYGEFACSDDAEAFGSAALGMEKEEYYHALCGLADQVGGCG